MDGPEILLVRHGRTAWNAERRFLGVRDLPLDEVGIQEVEALRAHPELHPLVCVYTSPLQRARQTAAVLAPEPIAWPELHEMDQGGLEGLLLPEAVERHTAFFEAWVEDPTGVVAPGGESLDACRDRALRAIEAIAARHRPGERVAVVTHQMVIASVCATLSGAGLKAWRTFGVPNGAWRRLQAASGLRYLG